MRRRFAGQAIEGSGASAADTLATVTEALKIALKGSRGGRLGAGTQEERAEGALAVPAATAGQATAAAPTAATGFSTTDITKLRSALGIDELMSSLKTAATQTETPEFKMPEFEMPKFEQPDWSSMMPDFESLIQQYLPKQETGETGTPTTGTSATTVTQTPQKTAGKKITVGGKTYDLSRAGGAGLGGQDIRQMQQKGFTKSQILKAAEQAKTTGSNVSKGAQKLLGQMGPAKKQPSAQAKTKAQTMTTAARQAVARTAPKPAARPAAAKPAARPAARPASRPAARGKK